MCKRVPRNSPFHSIDISDQQQAITNGQTEGPSYGDAWTHQKHENAKTRLCTEIGTFDSLEECDDGSYKPRLGSELDFSGTL